MEQSQSVQPEILHVSTSSVGNLEIAPPSFLERWGVTFLAWIGGWILLTGTGIVAFFLAKQPPAPNLAGLSPDAMQTALQSHKLLLDQWRDSLSYTFDLLITKTALPLATLLLGYLFGKGKTGSS